MKKLIIVPLREFADRIIGALYVFDGTMEQGKFLTLELPWRENERQVSCIPGGTYRVKPRTNEKFGAHLLVEGVAGRSWILLHSGNKPEDTLGCILVGMRTGDLDGDGIPEVLSSRAAMSLLTQLVNEEAELVIYR